MSKFHKPMAEFPECIKSSLPEARSTISDDLQGYVLNGEKCQVVFWEVKHAFQVEEHTHAHAEWGIVVQGSCDLTVGGETVHYAAGQEFYVPGGIPHVSVMSDHYRAIDFFGTSNWIQTKA